MSDYPEHEKLKAISDKSQIVGEFLDWLADGGYQGEHVNRMVWREWEEAGECPSFHRSVPLEDCKRCGGTDCVNNVHHEGWVHLHASTSALLAAFFGIDEAKLETEKRRMLDALRAMNEARA